MTCQRCACKEYCRYMANSLNSWANAGLSNAEAGQKFPRSRKGWAKVPQCGRHFYLNSCHGVLSSSSIFDKISFYTSYSLSISLRDLFLVVVVLPLLLLLLLLLLLYRPSLSRYKMAAFSVYAALRLLWLNAWANRTYKRAIKVTREARSPIASACGSMT